VPALNALYHDYRDRAAFYIVYIQEAHPIDAWQLDDNLEDDVLVASTMTEDERLSVAGMCVRNLGIELPALVDAPDNGVERAYTGWPDRLYVVGRDGRIAYKSAPGPFGFKPAEVQATLERLLPAVARTEARAFER
jgi:type I thyroxine 5'-deiodinase